MENTRLEILKDGIYIYLKLGESGSIKYNSVINKIGKVDSREISHSNTFSIPWTYNNINALGLNTFNVEDLAIGLNQKYEAKYYKEGILLQTGFVVINNTNGESIQLNFIDEALSLTEKWGATTYKELIQNKILDIPVDYKTAIAEMENYSMSKTTVLPFLSNIPNETFPLSVFPNNLNVIGDKWQEYRATDGVDGTVDLRIINSFNPYQSRPAFNAYAFLNMICKSYGFTPIFDASIDWDIVRKTYITTEGLNKSGKDNGGILGINHGLISYTNAHYAVRNNLTDLVTSQVAMEFDTLTGVTPNSLVNFPVNPTRILTPETGFRTKRSIFIPNTTAGNVGTIRFTANYNVDATGAINQNIVALYENISGTSTELLCQDVIPTINNSTTFTVDLTIDKVDFDTPPVNGGNIVGVYLLGEDVGENQTAMTNMQVIESYLPVGVISYDEQGQFLANSIDLTYAASQKTISTILKGLMHKEGMLMNIDSLNKEVEFFSYSKYRTNRDAGLFSDWTQYLQEYTNPNFNTNYGNEYAIINQIGLSGPYPGNTSKVTLGNQTSNSKYKDFTENYLSEFGDVSTINKILNTVTEYTEYSVEGASLVERATDLGTLIQRRWDQNPLTTQGNLIGLPALENVNYSVIPGGITEWYNLIDTSVRANPTFLLPINIVKNLDLRLPIYVGQLGGFYILEELEGYEDSSTTVTAKLIKLPI